MPTKQKVTSEQPKETMKTSRKKYKEKKKTGKSKTASQKKTRTKRGGSPVSKKGSLSNTERRSKEMAKFEIEDANGRTRKEQKKLQKAEKKANKRPIRRIFPIWLRLIVIPLLCAAALLLGLMFGYGILGDGNPKDALNMDTWQHIVDIVRKK